METTILNDAQKVEIIYDQLCKIFNPSKNNLIDSAIKIYAAQKQSEAIEKAGRDIKDGLKHISDNSLDVRVFNR